MSGITAGKRLVKRIAWGVLAAIALVVLLVKPILLLVPLAIVLYFVVVAIIYFYIGVQNGIDDTYRIPGTQIVLRTQFESWAIAVAPYLEIKIADNLPLKFCLAGPALTRAQLYSVQGGGILLETALDTFLIRTEPFSVDGPRSWMVASVHPNKNGVCDYDARGDPQLNERLALKADLKLTYIGAFDQVSNGSWYRKFWPAAASPEQKIVPAYTP